MTAIQQYRPFIHRDREDIDAFLDENPLWADLYEIYLSVRENGYYQKIPSIKMFNEVHYQCVRVLLDRHPEEDIQYNYFDTTRDNLGGSYSASVLCFSMVYAILSLVNNPPRQVRLFLRFLREKMLNMDEYYFPSISKYAYAKGAQGKINMGSDIDLAPCPELPSRIGETFEWWRRATDNFDQKRIRSIVSLWHTKEEQLKALEIIEENFKQIK
ncbi:hypothetical protein [Phocaeicola sp.]